MGTPQTERTLGGCEYQFFRGMRKKNASLYLSGTNASPLLGFIGITS